MIYVATSDKYKWLMPGFAHFFNKYWGKEKVVVLSYSSINDLPPNFHVHVFDEDDSVYWTNSILNYFSSIYDPYFLLFLDDYWLCDWTDHPP